jgi:cytochrome c oxidase cbb3-type subunit 3
MPPFAYLGKTKIKQLVSYLRSNTTAPNRSKEVDAQPNAKGDVSNGAYLFKTICSTCHGKNGDGYIAGGTGTAIGKKGFISKASDGFIRETIKYGRSGTKMLGFSGSSGLANLNNQEIDDVIVYLHALANK